MICLQNIHKMNKFISNQYGKNKEKEAKKETPISVSQLNNQVNEVKEITKDVILTVVDRENRLKELEKKTEQMKTKGHEFKLSANKVKKKYQCQNIKWTIILIVVLLIFLVIISGSFIYYAMNKK